ncbi:hypothetical protein AB6A40_002894 [Gnathostoma spinigerum]|uniref:Myeloid leukemia factor n=1 Tax=Gnathostoma spinigerum TaxID=75299 RepID=A0ABD6EIQ9_9BILA
MLEDGTNRGVNGRRHPQERDDLALMDPFGGFGTGGIFGGLMRHMEDLQANAMNDPNAHVFSQSTMVTFDGRNGGQPRVVQNSVRKTGEAIEKRHSVRSGNSGVGDRMSIEHTLGGRTHIIEKKRDRDGRIRERQQFVNLSEDEAEEFDREFTSRARAGMGAGGFASTQAIEGGRSRSRSKTNKHRHATVTPGDQAPVITLPEEVMEDEDVAPPTNSGNKTHSRASNGPIIREISEEEAEMSIPKRRKGVFGRLFKANDE